MDKNKIKGKGEKEGVICRRKKREEEEEKRREKKRKEKRGKRERSLCLESRIKNSARSLRNRREKQVSGFVLLNHLLHFFVLEF